MHKRKEFLWEVLSDVTLLYVWEIKLWCYALEMGQKLIFFAKSIDVRLVYCSGKFYSIGELAGELNCLIVVKERVWLQCACAGVRSVYVSRRSESFVWQYLHAVDTS